MHSLIILPSYRKIFMSVCFRKIEMEFQLFPLIFIQLNSVNNLIIFASSAFLLFLSSQSSVQFFFSKVSSIPFPLSHDSTHFSYKCLPVRVPGITIIVVQGHISVELCGGGRSHFGGISLLLRRHRRRRWTE